MQMEMQQRPLCLAKFSKGHFYLPEMLDLPDLNRTSCVVTAQHKDQEDVSSSYQSTAAHCGDDSVCPGAAQEL